MGRGEARQPEPPGVLGMVGMSVPPFMTQVVAEAVRDQWLTATKAVAHR